MGYQDDQTDGYFQERQDAHFADVERNRVEAARKAIRLELGTGNQQKKTTRRGLLATVFGLGVATGVAGTEAANNPNLVRNIFNFLNNLNRNSSSRR